MSNVLNPDLVLRGQNGQQAGGRTYVAFLRNFASYATPTDMIGLRGAAGKAITVRFFGMLCQSTAATLKEFFFYRRALLDTLGTPTAITPVPYDTRGVAAAAVFNAYTALPTINDGAAPIIGYANALTAVLTGSPAAISLATSGLSLVVNVNVDIGKPLTILENQELVMNLAGAALPAGFLGCPLAQWVETDL